MAEKLKSEKLRALLQEFGLDFKTVDFAEEPDDGWAALARGEKAAIEKWHGTGAQC